MFPQCNQTSGFHHASSFKGINWASDPPSTFFLLQISNASQFQQSIKLFNLQQIQFYTINKQAKFLFCQKQVTFLVSPNFHATEPIEPDSAVQFAFFFIPVGYWLTYWYQEWQLQALAVFLLFHPLLLCFSVKCSVFSFENYGTQADL